MAFDLGLIAHAADGKPVKLPIQRARNALADARLADAGRADQTDDTPLHAAGQFADADEFKDPLFDIFETVMILFENFFCFADDRGSLGYKCPTGQW